MLCNFLLSKSKNFWWGILDQNKFIKTKNYGKSSRAICECSEQIVSRDNERLVGFSCNRNLFLHRSSFFDTNRLRDSLRMIRWLVIYLIIFLIDSIRPLIGPSNVCIYPVSCRNYAKKVLTEKNILVALTLIFLRLISCNPITALCRFVLKKLGVV